ncbi:hypothetical protein [Halalkalibacter krulwichiae]|uniref:YceG-like family protein n=1 Tax=Halalkalibacter krulwichiae TaxID=199441 RepID=A0A1X9MGU8_9BACI|nr:hypothetical protein [Halalkalibacter krulwichiae]ARK32687.1 YceG-like family protein [Halalkalibacter krulwichiae]
MKANTLRSFAGGLIVAATVCGAVYFFGTEEGQANEASVAVTTEDLITELAAEGYMIQTEEQWQEQLAAAEQAIIDEIVVEPEADEEEKEEEEKEEEEVKEVVIYKTMLTVSPGMTSIDVGEALVRANIIDSAMKFFNEVEKRDLANELRPGTFEVDSDMSLKEVINLIFRQ